MNAAISEIQVEVNGAARSFAAPVTLQGLLHELGLVERRGIAVAVNDSVVPRSQWPLRSLEAGERILVIQATQGG